MDHSSNHSESSPTDGDLGQYVSKARRILANFEGTIGWKPPKLDSETDCTPCPHNRDHIIMRKSLESHLKSCKWKAMGYSPEEVTKIVEEELCVRQDHAICFNSDSIIAKISPCSPLIRSDEKYTCHLTPEQRLAVYDEEIKQCYSVDKPLTDKALYADLESQAAEKLYQKENPDNLSEIELLQKMRDMKKRRQSYRAKNVHITKRSQTEIIRSVLEVHMDELRKLWNTKHSDDSEIGNAIHEEKRLTGIVKDNIDRDRTKDRMPNDAPSSSRHRIYYPQRPGQDSESFRKNDESIYSSKSRSHRKESSRSSENRSKSSSSKDKRHDKKRHADYESRSYHKSKCSKRSPR